MSIAFTLSFITWFGVQNAESRLLWARLLKTVKCLLRPSVTVRGGKSLSLRSRRITFTCLFGYGLLFPLLKLLNSVKVLLRLSSGSDTRSLESCLRSGRGAISLLQPGMSAATRSSDISPHRRDFEWAYLLVGGEHPIWEEAIESLVNPRQSEMKQMIEPRFTPAHTHPFEALLNQPFTGTFH